MNDPPRPLIVNGWSIFAHPLFLDQLEVLIAEVERARARDPDHYRRKNAAKRLAAVARLAFAIVPRDPADPRYRQGDTLGPEYRHWFRARFFQRYRLFFRYGAAERVIIYAWINDRGSLREAGGRRDVYRTFQRMLEHGRPPDDWERLLAEARAASERLGSTLDRLSEP